MGACVCLILTYGESPFSVLFHFPPFTTPGTLASLTLWTFPSRAHPARPHPLGASRPAAPVSPPVHLLSSYSVLLIASSLFFSMFYVYTIKKFLYCHFCGVLEGKGDKTHVCHLLIFNQKAHGMIWNSFVVFHPLSVSRLTQSLILHICIAPSTSH